MRLLDFYLNKNEDKEWFEEFSSSSDDCSGKFLSCFNVNFRSIKSFYTQLQTFENKLGLKREEWKDYQKKGQERDKHRINSLINAGFIELKDNKYNITKKGEELFRIYKNPLLTENEKRLLNFMLFVNYSKKNNEYDLIKRTLKLESVLTKQDFNINKLLVELKKSINLTTKEDFVKKDIFWLMSFIDDEEFIKFYLRSTKKEKEDLFNLVINRLEKKNEEDVISKKFRNGGVYTSKTFKDEINIVFSILILLAIMDIDWINYINIISAFYADCNPNKIISFINENKNVYEKVYSNSFLKINNICKKDKKEEIIMSIQKNLKEIKLVLEIETGIEPLSPEWFEQESEKFKYLDEKTESIYLNFQNSFNKEQLIKLSGEELINNLFIGKNNINLCYELEQISRQGIFLDGAKNKNLYEYPLFFDKEKNSWVTCTDDNFKLLTIEEAIEKGQKIRDELLEIINTIEKIKNFKNVQDYITLQEKIEITSPDLFNNKWVIKYLHMIFKDLIPVFCDMEMQNKVLNILDINPLNSMYGKIGQIIEFKNTHNFSNLVFGKIIKNYLMDTKKEERVNGGENIIFYGVPGSGKSHIIKEEYCKDENYVERLVFHPDYTYTDFIGQIMPKITEDKNLIYEFNPGPFTKILKKSYENPSKKFYLIIEEINRGNAPAIFGDVFQLLDRQGPKIKDYKNNKWVDNPSYGESEYSITNLEIAKTVYGDEEHKVSIPSNLYILCTMNTSDQNVFTLDTAFQRRWNMKLIKNELKNDEFNNEFINTKILDSNITWQKFLTVINELIIEKSNGINSTEDKRMGIYFVNSEELKLPEDNNKNLKFPEKVLKYMWDDAFKFNRDEVFDIQKVNTLEKVIKEFSEAKEDQRFFKIFKENVAQMLKESDSDNEKKN
ncbi:McrB family protein [Mycoplasmopsis gallinacea]|uniref:AAA domain-containing protein n=1 Tax=Mycoplasmopsis gallinacea TaxID=29556 RepID=A0A6H0V4Z1_9BACT|nr:AAA family ATPase [Mycoplasmopsis gallinacea]QIW62043.1 AAA domain-containing protein [Mycoplasmopsis gallinacea]